MGLTDAPCELGRNRIAQWRRSAARRTPLAGRVRPACFKCDVKTCASECVSCLVHSAVAALKPVSELSDGEFQFSITYPCRSPLLRRVYSRAPLTPCRALTTHSSRTASLILRLVVSIQCAFRKGHQFASLHTQVAGTRFVSRAGPA